MTYFQRLIVNTLTFITLSVFLPDQWFHVSGVFIAIIASFVLSILNACVKPILLLLSLPLNLLTLGLFSFIVNAFMLKMTSFFMGEINFGFSSFWVAILVAIIMALVNAILTESKMSEYPN